MEPGIIILAAGSSTRMGQSKQLLEINGQSLLEHAASEALRVSNMVLVVLGAQYEKHHAAIVQLPVHSVENKHWKKGMGGSLKTGLSYMLSGFPMLDSVLILVCDQPFLKAELLEKIIEASKETKNSIVASAYGKTVGVPALFKRPVFQNLLLLNDKDGAKAILLELSNSVVTVNFPGGEVDLDTMEDYESFVK